VTQLTGRSAQRTYYSVRKACIGSIRMARRAGNQAAAMVMQTTAAIALKMDTGSSGLRS